MKNPRKTRLTRRRLLRGGLGGVATLLGCRAQSVQETKTKEQRVPRVHVARCADYERTKLLSVFEEGWNAISAPKVHGLDIVLKPNFVEYHPERPINTDPRLVAALIEYLRAAGARRVTVAEAPGHRRDARDVWKCSGLGRTLEELKVPLIDLNHDDLTALKTNIRGTGGRILLPKTILNADLLISLPKLKTHHWALATLSLKNAFGIVPGIRYGWPKNILHWNGIERSIVELNRLVTFNLAIVDGVVGMEGDGPLFGSPVNTGLIIMGKDLVAVDAAAGQIMGYAPSELAYLEPAVKAGIGSFAPTRFTGIDPRTVARSFVRPPKI